SADRVQVGGAVLAVEGGLITGLGEPLKADLSRSASEIRIRLDGPSIDLARVALLAGRPDAVRSGHLAIKGDVALRRDSAAGELHVRADQVSTPQITGAKLDLDARFAGRKVDVTMNGELAEAGHVELAANDVVIGGAPSDLASWKRAHGRAKFSANLDIKKLATLAPKDSLPFSELAGQLVIAGALRRDSANVPPELSVHTHTRGLVIAGKGAHEPDHDTPHGQRVEGVQPWRSEGVDVSLDARVDATSGLGEVAFHSVDDKGTLVGFDAKSDLPYAQMFADPGNALALLEKTPVVARLVVPKRALAEFPQLAGTRRLPGSFEAQLDFTGTALQPRIAFVAHARGVRAPSLDAKLAADADVTLDYDGEKADLLAKVTTQDHPALEIGAHVDVRARDLVQRAPGQALAWGGSARVKLAKFPLQTITPLAARRVRGQVSGEAVLADLHQNAKLNARLVLDGLKVGRAKYERGTIVVKAEDGALTAGVRLDQADGFLDLQAVTGLAWGAALVPSPDPGVDTQAHLEAKGFRAAALLPFVQGPLNELDGRIDANATVKIGPGFKDPTMEGQVAFHDGTVQLSAIGEEYKNAKANVRFLPGGVIKISDVFLQGTEGQLVADAEVKTRGLGLASATANVTIPRKRPLDLAVQGQALGAVSGNVKLAATSSADGRTMKVQVDVPTLDVALPQRLKSGVQELSEKKSIRVGVFRDDKTFVKLPLDKEDLQPAVAKDGPGTVMDVDVRLGEVTVVQGSGVKIVLTGNPHIKVASATEVTGQIEVKEGKIDVQGKTFKIERGTVTFQPQDASNPIVVATAAWTAEDGSQIYADFVGPVKTGKVTLRSDPPRPRNEVLAMILFGTADGANPPPTGSAGSTDGTTKAAASVGGGFATQGLTEAMDDLTGIQATAKIDTTRSSNPAPEIEFQIARRISLAFEHVLGTPPISQPDTNLATVDWRFRKNWSLETTFGDKGLIQTDAVWQKRY
ncbi:MAG TPA: translocation/assembly module TamB domain-containing protein, partial [Labilithrix sp.]|nr:translocation/assembly module TamB domain-containing protein [Labilithrix sp.]